RNVTGVQTCALPICSARTGEPVAGWPQIRCGIPVHPAENHFRGAGEGRWTERAKTPFAGTADPVRHETSRAGATHGAEPCAVDGPLGSAASASRSAVGSAATPEWTTEPAPAAREEFSYNCAG